MIDKNKQYRTRDGREVRIYATDGVGRCHIHGATKGADGWYSKSWFKNGKKFDVDDPHYEDLIEVRPRHKRTVWVNAYADNTNAVFGSKEVADNNKYLRLACIKVELDFEEGEGL